MDEISSGIWWGRGSNDSFWGTACRPGSGTVSLAVGLCPWKRESFPGSGPRVPVGLLPELAAAPRAGSCPPRRGLWATQPCRGEGLLHLLNTRIAALETWRLFILTLINPSGLYIKRAAGEKILQLLQVLKSWAVRAAPEASVAKRLLRFCCCAPVHAGVRLGPALGKRVRMGSVFLPGTPLPFLLLPTEQGGGRGLIKTSWLFSLESVSRW